MRVHYPNLNCSYKFIPSVWLLSNEAYILKYIKVRNKKVSEKYNYEICQHWKRVLTLNQKGPHINRHFNLRKKEDIWQKYETPLIVRG